MDSQTERFLVESILLGYEITSLVKNTWKENIIPADLIKGFLVAKDKLRYLNTIMQFETIPSDVFFYQESKVFIHKLGLSAEMGYYLEASNLSRLKYRFTCSGFQSGHYRLIVFNPRTRTCSVIEELPRPCLMIVSRRYTIDFSEVENYLLSKNPEDLLSNCREFARTSEVYTEIIEIVN
ncbi:MAG TPA: hypothetical protein GX005_02010 [Bacteroidales bacterium]|nr:hypothetical protein [Bacteroidales bacterium]